MYRLFLLFVDLAFLGFIIFLTIKERPSSSNDIATITVICVLLLLNITYIFFSKTGKELWLTLYFKRKALEEKKKIQDLQNE